MTDFRRSRRILVPEQPTYLAWPGYFARMIGADQVVLMDDVQFTDRGWQNRNHIWDPQLGRRMLTIPVIKNGRFGQKINEVEISGSDWKEKHFRLINHSYPKLSKRGEVGDSITSYYKQEYERLIDASTAFIDMALKLLDINLDVTLSSELCIEGEKTTRLVNLCHATGCNVMRVGQGALNYLDVEMLSDSGIEVEVIQTRQMGAVQSNDYDLNRISILDTLIRNGSNSKDELERNHSMRSVQKASAEAAAGN